MIIYGGKKRGTLIGISDDVGKYTLFLSIVDEELSIVDFMQGISQPRVRDGENILDLAEYDGKYINIQITAERDAVTKVYINGTLKLTFNSGHDIVENENVCVGNLRANGSLRYFGNIYDFALYGEILTDEEVAQNWNYVKNELGINEAGEKVN